jgi:hypothetical protein
VAVACWWSPYNQPEFWLLRAPRGRMAVSQPWDPGGGLGPRVRPYLVRPTPWAYDGVPGEGSIPVPLPPPLYSSKRLNLLFFSLERKGSVPKSAPKSLR